jgi:hypothetical protein
MVNPSYHYRLVYATIHRGEILDREGVTAIHYRKAASQ